MKKIIDRKIYNTETAKKVAYWSNDYGTTDFKWQSETLYCSPKGQYFLHGEGGPMSAYAVHKGNESSGGENIKLMTEDDTMDWMENRQLIKEMQELFGAQVEQG